MNKWLAAFGTLAALAYFGVARDTDARPLGRPAVDCSCGPCQSPGLCDHNLPPPTRDWPPAYGFRRPAGAKAESAAPTRPPAPPVVPPPTPLAGGKLYLLLLTDDAAKDGGEANKAGAALIERLVRQGLAKDKLGAVVALNGADVSQANVRDRLAALAIRADDAILCYYSGPATYDDATRSFTLTPAGTRLPRSELRADLQSYKPGLIVLLTDAPSNAVKPGGLPPPAFPSVVAPLDRLLLDSKGLVDLHAAAGGEFASARGTDAGLFTLALTEELAKGSASWAQLVPAAAATTDRLYRQLRTAVLTSDAVPADEKRVYREQPAQTPTPLSPIDPLSAAPEIPSFPPPAEALRVADAPPRPAEIVVRLPAGARLLIDGVPMKQSSAERRFETPELKPGRTYAYALRAEFATGGKPAVRELKVEVRAGEEKTVVVE